MVSRANPASRRRFRLKSLLGIAGTVLLLPTAAFASCNNRPGTPTDVTATALSMSEIRLNFRDTRGAGETAGSIFGGPPSIAYFDVEVTDQNGNLQPQTSAGRVQGYVHRMNYEIYKNLAQDKTYCFRLKARTEPGTQGCVSLRWSGRACATTPVPALVSVPIKYVKGNGPWSSVALSRDGIWGYAVNRQTEAQARKDSKAGCGSQAARCTDVGAFQYPCVAYADQRETGYSYGVGYGNDARRAGEIAFDGCIGGGGSRDSCKIVEIICRRP